MNHYGDSLEDQRNFLELCYHLPTGKPNYGCTRANAPVPFQSDEQHYLSRNRRPGQTQARPQGWVLTSLEWLESVFSVPTEPVIEQVKHPKSRQVIWKGTDPRTGQSIYMETDREMMEWLEEWFH